jgi:hypothetical protein
MIVNFHHCRNEFGNFNKQWNTSLQSLSYAEMERLETVLKEYFPKDIGIWYINCSYLTINFYTKEDNDYFKILASGGIEI